MEEQLLKVHSCCPLCKSHDFVTVLKLQDTPLEDQFLKNITNQSTYPLELALCNECGYVFLPHRISPEASYSDYIYVSGVTVGLRNHYDSYARQIISDYKIPRGSLAVDLGSNVGLSGAKTYFKGMKKMPEDTDFDKLWKVMTEEQYDNQFKATLQNQRKYEWWKEEESYLDIDKS